MKPVALITSITLSLMSFMSSAGPFIVDHKFDIPNEMVTTTNPAELAKFNKEKTAKVRPGDTITYELSPDSPYKFVGIAYTDFASLFTVLEKNDRVLTIFVFPNALDLLSDGRSSIETKSILKVENKISGQGIDVDPPIVIGNLF